MLGFKGQSRKLRLSKGPLQELQFTDRGSMGRSLPFEEQVARERQNAAIKAELSDIRAAKSEQRSDELYNHAKDMASVIPFGQPILIGHHSEKRDRNYRDKIHSTFGKAFAEQDKANYYLDKAEMARFTAEGKKYSNPKFLTNRLKECNKNIALYERRLKGKFYTYSPEQEISEESRAFYTDKLSKEQDRKGFYLKCMKAINPEYNEPVKGHVKKNAKGKGI